MLMLFCLEVIFSLILSLVPVSAHAAVSIDKGENKTVFVSKDGKILTPLEANHKAENNETVLACKVQDYVCNERTGKCAMKNAK